MERESGDADEVAIIAGELEVVFSRCGDRFRHVIRCARGAGQSLLASVEGTAEDAWPPSPPFQELHVDHRGDKQVALLVGRAGRSHWSMSVEPELANGSIVFDVACRSSTAIDWLGSSYQVADAEAVATDDGELHFVSGYELHVAEGAAELHEAGEERLVQIAAQVERSRSPQTVRWLYRLTPRKIKVKTK